MIMKSKLGVETYPKKMQYQGQKAAQSKGIAFMRVIGSLTVLLDFVAEE